MLFAVSPKGVSQLMRSPVPKPRSLPGQPLLKAEEQGYAGPSTQLQSPWDNARAAPEMASLLVLALPRPDSVPLSLPQAWIPRAPIRSLLKAKLSIHFGNYHLV